LRSDNLFYHKDWIWSDWHRRRLGCPVWTGTVKWWRL